MAKIVNYHVSPIDEVIIDIEKGWIPSGSPVITKGGDILQAMIKYDKVLEEPIAHAIDRPVRLTVFKSGAEELSVFLTPGRDPIQFVRSNHTDRWEQQ